MGQVLPDNKVTSFRQDMLVNTVFDHLISIYTQVLNTSFVSK